MAINEAELWRTLGDLVRRAEDASAGIAALTSQVQQVTQSATSPQVCSLRHADDTRRLDALERAHDAAAGGRRAMWAGVAAAAVAGLFGLVAAAMTLIKS